MESRSKLRERWFDKVSPLPPQLSLQHISAISICSVVGTGVFISTLSTSIREAGPAGVLIAYLITSSIVYATAISNAEMMAHMPNVGGPVGLADVFVDPALGFAMGWGSWYHWSIIIPVQIGAAGRLAKSFVSLQVTHNANIVFYTMIAIFMAFVVSVNFLSAKKFGAIHIVFALLKIATLIILIVTSLIIDWTAVPRCNTFPAPANCPLYNSTLSQSCMPSLSGNGDTTHIGGAYWHCPGPFVRPFGTKGVGGSIMGVFTVLIQAAFSFFGTEVAGVPGREIQNPTHNIPRAIRRVWIRITVLYVLAVVAAGLVVPSNHPDLKKAPLITGSPWTIAYTTATGSNAPRYILTVLFMLSALSAASADIWVASRYLFFLARRGHAPLVFGALYKSGYTTPILPYGVSRSSRQLNSETSPISPTGASPEMRSLGLTGMLATEPLLPYTPTQPRPTHTRATSSLGGGTLIGSPTSPESATALLQPHRRLPSVTGPVTLPAISLRTPAPPDEHGVRPSTLIAPTSAAVVITTPPRSRPPTGQSVSSAVSQPLTAKTITTRPNTGQSAMTASTDPGSAGDGSLGKSPSAQSPSLSPGATTVRPPRLRRAHTIAPLPPPDVVVPWVGVLFGGAVALLVFMAPEAQSDKKVKTAFSFFTQMTNCASLVGWIGMLIAYLRFYNGTVYAESKDPGFRDTHKASLYDNRAWGQPYVAWYGLVCCTIILLGQGWSVFTLPGVKRIAELEGDPKVTANTDVGDFAFSFIIAYLPVGLFLLLLFGYKLVYQTRFVPIDEMRFARGRVPAAPATEPQPRNLWERIYMFIL